MVTVTFHMLLLLNYRQVENIRLPLARFAMILLGFLLAAIVTTFVVPAYAGDSLHALAAKNLAAAGQALERYSAVQYCILLFSTALHSSTMGTASMLLLSRILQQRDRLWKGTVQQCLYSKVQSGTVQRRLWYGSMVAWYYSVVLRP